MTAYSVLPAQICLLNLGLLFGPGPVRQRLFVYWLLSIVLLASWFAWLVLAAWLRKEALRGYGDFAVMVMWLTPYVLTLQLPSLSLLIWRWQLVNAKVVEAPAVRRGSFSIRDLMIATAVVAVTLVWYRWLLQLSGEWAISNWEQWIEMWWRTLGIGVAIVPPTLAWLALRNFSYVWGWCLSVVYSLFVVASGCVIHHYFDELHLGGGTLAIIVGMSVGFALPMIVGLNLLRSFGWRLERRSKPIIS